MSDKILKQLHAILGTELLNRIESGGASSQDLNVARQFLKDNGIEGIPADGSTLGELVDALPFDEDGEPVAKIG